MGTEPSTSAVEVTQQGSDSDINTGFDSESDSVVRPHFTGQTEEGGLSGLDQDVSVTDVNQATFEEQNYKETVWYTLLHDTHSGYGFCYVQC